MASEEDSNKKLKTVIGIERSKNKERLEWVMSGLNQHVLTKAEDRFVKTALEDFDKTQQNIRRQGWRAFTRRSQN